MAVLNDYRCKAHGVFESFEPKCPKGCTGGAVEKLILKAPGFLSAKTKEMKALTNVALDRLGRGGMHEPVRGESQVRGTPGGNPMEGIPSGAMWRDVKQLGSMQTKQIRDEPTGFDVGTLEKVKPSHVLHDPQNLKAG